MKKGNNTISSIFKGSKTIDKIMKGTLVVYEAFKKLIASGVPPITLQKCKGVNLVDYKIYGDSVQDGTPTPDTPIEVESVGDKTNNLFNNDISVSNVLKDGNDVIVKGYAAGTGMKPSQFLEMTGLKIGDKFTIKRSFTVEKGTASTVTGAIRFLKSDGSSDFFGLIGGSDKVKTVTIPADFNDDTYSGLYFYGVPTAENGQRLVRFSNVQIVKGSYTNSTMPKYEPYGYKIPVKVNGNVTNIYLKEPLRKINDYTDYIDFENGKVVRNVFCRNFTGGESIAVPGTAITGYTPFRYIDTNPITYPFVCNYLPFWNIQYSNASGKECLTRVSSSGKQMFFTISNDRIPLNDTTAFKNWLKELNSSGNPMTVYSCLTTPKDTEKIELPSILLNKGTNVIEVDTTILPSNMEIVYYGKTNILLLNEEENIILNSIINDDTNTEKDIGDNEIEQILDEIIGG